MGNRSGPAAHGVAVATSGEVDGDIRLSGSKNVSLKLMALASLFLEGLEVKNVPRNAQANFFCDVWESIGGGCSRRLDEEFGMTVRMNGAEIMQTSLSSSDVRYCRHLFLMSVGLLLRVGTAYIPATGYSHYGFRPVSAQIDLLERFGAAVSRAAGGWSVSLPPGGLSGAEIALSAPSVAATETALVLASCATGHSSIVGGALEPETHFIAEVLSSAGAKITGLGTGQITVEGPGFGALSHPDPIYCPVDRIETAVLAALPLVVGGRIVLRGGHDPMPAVVNALRMLGAEVTTEGSSTTIAAERGQARSANITTRPFPGFPTDAQGPFMTVLALANGVSVLHETIWPNRVSSQAMELIRMGADVSVYDGSLCVLRGVHQLWGGVVVGTDPRATAGLVYASLVAEGESVVIGADLLDNAFESLPEKLASVGMKVGRVVTEDPRVHPVYGRLEAF